MDKGINTEQIKDILKEELSINHKPNWGASYIDGIDECAERLVKFISSNLSVIKSVCEHKRRHFDIKLGGWFCRDCNEKINEQTVL